MNARDSRIVGILLAAGRGERFGGGKLLHSLPVRTRSAAGKLPRPPDARVSVPKPSLAGECIGVIACRHLLAVLPRVVAVVRPDDAALAVALGAAGARIVRCLEAGDGMGASLACAVRATENASGWIVALGDMPWIAQQTIERVAAALDDGAIAAAPFHRGQRGHPVGFGASCYAVLAALTGDDGAKSVLAAHRERLVRIDVDDAGSLADIDRRSDLDQDWTTAS